MPPEVLEAEKEGADSQDGAAYTRIGIISGTVRYTRIDIGTRVLASSVAW